VRIVNSSSAASPNSPTAYRDLSYWFASLPEPVVSRPALAGDLEVDVAVVGAGYTGLWTAYYLAKADPKIRIAVLEREVAGFGASGRNGGWCSALFATSSAKLIRNYGGPAEEALRKALEHTIDEVGAVAATEGIDCHYRKGGTVMLARNAAQVQRARDEVDEARSLGIGEADLRLLSASEARELVGATQILGATYSPHCASIHPARLVRGLADVVERLGARILEQTEVVEIHPGRVVTTRGTVRAEAVVRATEGFTSQLPGSDRDVIPFYSLMIATEPIAEEILEEIGLRNGETFNDLRHLVIYGQRTLDGRIAFGGRGAPYHFGSRIEPSFDRDTKMHSLIRETLVELFPALRETAITHRWGGPVGIARDWHPSVGFDRAKGLGWAGGYVGDGVAVTNLAGRTLAALVSGEENECTRLCWVGHRSRRWEPEPLRWIGVNTALQAMGTADRAEQRSGRPSRLAKAMSGLVGG
jgi:glycine/D-amino acid oxidase-like deaminating enzyme